jgi:hypothetical protein
MKSKIIIVFLLLPVMLFASPDASDKVLRRDLDKLFKQGTYDLVALEIPEKIQLTGKYYQVVVSGITKAYVYIGRVSTVRSASARNQGSGTSSEYFDYFILYDNQLVVTNVKIVRYLASHGQMVSAPSWLKQFRGYKPGQPLEVGMQVDAISGATISVNAITFDVRKNSSILKQVARMRE